MKFYKNWIVAIFAVMGCLSSMAYADSDSAHDSEVNEKDDKALREFLASKRAEDLINKGSNIILSGDVRTEWRHMTERVGHHHPRRGFWCSRNCDGLPISKNDFDIEANLWVNYTYGCAWAIANLQFDNAAGIDDNSCCCDISDCRSSKEAAEDCTLDRFHGSGRCDKLCLKRAYIGYTAFDDCGRLDIELGRRRMYDVFESDIEFLSRFDGILLKYSNSFECFSDWYIKWGGFLVDERVNQFAWASELAFFNICDSGFDFKYSYIDWSHKGRSRCGGRNPKGFDYHISQALINYNIDPELLSTRAVVYGAVLYNHTANQVGRAIHDDEHDHHKGKKHRGLGWYTGILVGEVEKEGDWSLELEYQYVDRNAIPFDDESGIGLGNVLEDCCGEVITRGYQGWQVEFLYAVTDNLTIDSILESSRSTESHRHTYSKVEIEAIYAF